MGQIELGRYSCRAATQFNYYYYSGSRIAEEVKVSDGSLLRWYCFGSQQVDDIVVRGTSTPSSEEFHVQDSGHDVVAMLDDAGAVDCRFVYDGYGSPRQLSSDWSTWETLSEDRLLGSGRPYHLDHSQYDLRARFYDPELGVFVQRDPIGAWADPLALGNPYSYSGSDPINKTDSTGFTATLSKEACSEDGEKGRKALKCAIERACPAYKVVFEPPTKCGLKIEPITRPGQGTKFCKEYCDRIASCNRVEDVFGPKRQGDKKQAKIPDIRIRFRSSGVAEFVPFGKTIIWPENNYSKKTNSCSKRHGDTLLHETQHVVDNGLGYHSKHDHEKMEFRATRAGNQARRERKLGGSAANRYEYNGRGGPYTWDSKKEGDLLRSDIMDPKDRHCGC